MPDSCFTRSSSVLHPQTWLLGGPSQRAPFPFMNRPHCLVPTLSFMQVMWTGLILTSSAMIGRAKAPSRHKLPLPSLRTVVSFITAE